MELELGILKFCNLAIKSQTNKEIILSVCEGNGAFNPIVLTLDDEDIKVLYDKYSKELQEELHTNIKILTKEYDKEDKTRSSSK